MNWKVRMRPRFVRYIALVVTILFIVTICYLAANHRRFVGRFHRDAYWLYPGKGDFWRMPLGKPYELSMIDSLDRGSIHIWKDSSMIVWSISRYARKDPFIYGELKPERASKPSGWFVFDLGNGHKELFKSEGPFLLKLRELGIDPIEMTSVRDIYHSYWRNPNAVRH